MNSMRSTCAGVFVLGASIILYEIALTRVFAVMMWHHFTYMVVSIALLGFGAAGSILTGRRAEDTNTSSRLAFYAMLFGVTATLAFCFVTLIRIDTLHILDQPRNLVGLLLFYLLISAPMLCGGLAIGIALMEMTREVNKIYFADLAGSALGGGLSVVLLRELGAVSTIMIVGALAMLAGLIFSWESGRARRIVPACGLILAVSVVCGFLGGAPALNIPAMSWEVPFAPDKEVNDIRATGVDKKLASATAQVEVSNPYLETPIQGGDLDLTTLPRKLVRLVTQDGTAPTMLFENAGDLDQFRFLRRSQAATGFIAREALGHKQPEVLVIGVGGGVDVMMSLLYDARSVTAVEINPAMHDMVTDHYDAFIGGLFRPGAHAYSERIKLVTGEGRSFMRHSDDKYDVIQMSGVDSFTALSTGAYTLSESYLYTVEAVQEFYAHLKDGGIVNYSRFMLSYPRKPRETLRLAGIARQALEEIGVQNPSAHICVFRGRNWASTMIKKGPFTRTEIRALHAHARSCRFSGLVYDPLNTSTAPVTTAAAGVESLVPYMKSALQRHLPNLPEDFDLDGLAVRLADATLKETDENGEIPEAILSEMARRVPAALRSRFTALARGFIKESRAFVDQENRTFNLARRDFAGLLSPDPAVRASFMAAYPYEMDACRDDTPFFFNYYKWSSIFSENWSRLFEEGFASKYHPDFPVGHAVLGISLIQIALLAALLIFLPLRRLKRRGIATPGRWRYLTYFAALGLGFMFIEIALMQKLVIFLGHPTYALSVVLTSLLAFAGLGSFLAGRIKRATRGCFMILLVGILSAIALELTAFEFLLREMLGASFGLRVAISIALLLPLGLALGTAFPTGLRAVQANCRALVPWAWAINGFTSVLASVLCIVLSQEIGFEKVFWLAGGIYLVGFLVVVPERSGSRAATTDEIDGTADQHHQE